MLAPLVEPEAESALQMCKMTPLNAVAWNSDFSAEFINRVKCGEVFVIETTSRTIVGSRGVISKSNEAQAHVFVHPLELVKCLESGCKKQYLRFHSNYREPFTVRHTKCWSCRHIELIPASMNSTSYVYELRRHIEFVGTYNCRLCVFPSFVLCTENRPRLFVKAPKMAKWVLCTSTTFQNVLRHGRFSSVNCACEDVRMYTCERIVWQSDAEFPE